jgi:hypothetical protein
VLSICLFDPWERFFSSLLPVLVIIVGKGADQSVSWLGYALGRFPSFSSEKIYRYSLAAAGILILALFIYGAVFLSRTEPVERIKEDFAAKKDMAEWLKPRISQDDNILASSVANRISFFLDISPRRQYLIPLASLPDTIAYARQNQVKYIIVTGTDLSRARQFIPIFKTNAQYPGINLEVFSQKPGQVPYAIYRVLAHSS